MEVSICLGCLGCLPPFSGSRWVSLKNGPEHPCMAWEPGGREHGLNYNWAMTLQPGRVLESMGKEGTREWRWDWRWEKKQEKKESQATQNNSKSKRKGKSKMR